MLSELLLGCLAAFIFYTIFFGTIYYVADRIGYLDTDEEKAIRRRNKTKEASAATEA
jgi:hypothetical protein